MLYLVDFKWFIENYCHACNVGLCCPKEGKGSGQGVAIRGELDNSFLVGAVPGPDFFVIGVGILSDRNQQFQRRIW